MTTEQLTPLEAHALHQLLTVGAPGDPEACFQARRKIARLSEEHVGLPYHKRFPEGERRG